MAIDQKNSPQVNVNSKDDDDLPPRMEHEPTSSTFTTEPKQASTSTPASGTATPNIDNDPPIPARAGFDLKAIKEALNKVKPEELNFSSAPVRADSKLPLIDRSESAPSHRRSTHAVDGLELNNREDISARLHRVVSLPVVPNSEYAPEQVQQIPHGKPATPTLGSPYEGTPRPSPSPRPTPFITPTPFANEVEGYSWNRPPEPSKFPHTPAEPPASSWGSPTESNNNISHPTSAFGAASPMSASMSVHMPGLGFSSYSHLGPPMGSFPASDDAVGLSFGGVDGSITTSVSPSPAADPWKIPSHIGLGKKNTGFSDNPWS